MKATAYLLGNYEELVIAQEQKELLALPKQKELKPKMVEREFHFALKMVATCFMTTTGEIKCQIAGATVLLKDEKDVYKKITDYLSTR